MTRSGIGYGINFEYFCKVLTEFKKHIEKQFPCLREKPFLLACSGGIDSVVLTHLCAEAGLAFELAHCNFRLRGAASEGDEQFVRELAIDYNKKIYVTHFETEEYITKNKVSLQMGARELRYDWFAEIMKKNAITTLVTAHHADDNLETFLINLSRGTGIDGLTGIPEKTDTIARPLLRFSREQILAYAGAHNLTWREDSSNADTKYLRNKIRHYIVPSLKELSPTFLNNFQKTQGYLFQTAEIVESQIKQLKNGLFEENGDVVRIPITPFVDLAPIDAYIYLLFKEYGFTEWDDVRNLLSAISGKEVRSRTHRLVKDRDFLLLTKIGDIDNDIYHIKEGQKEVKEPVKLQIEEVKNWKEKGNHILYIDKEALKYPLSIRKWKKGDYFYPLGMAGKKKLSKFFKDEKIDILAKEKQWLLCSGNEIVWVIGRRTDNRFKVSDSTSTILKFVLDK